MEIKSPEQLNDFVETTENKIAEIAAHAEKIGDIELIKEENKELRTLVETLTTSIEEVKEAQTIKYLVKSEDERKHEFGRFMLAAAKGDMKTVYELGGKVNINERNEDWKGKDWNFGDKAATDLGTPLRGDAVTGSILIPETFASEVLRIPEDGSGMMGKVRSIPMTTRKINYPKTLAGVAFTWVTNEITAKTEDNPTFSEVELEAETAAAWIAMTEEFQEDSMVDMAQYLAELFREAWQKEFDNQCLVADSAPFDGVMEASGVNSVTMGAGEVSFTDVDDTDIIAMIEALDSQTKRNGASFIMHPTILDSLKKLKDDNGYPIFAGMGQAQPTNLYGYPIIFSDAMPDSSSSAVSSPFLVFGNPRHIMHGNRVGLEFRIFSETSDALVYDRNFFRVRLRQGFVVGNPEGFSVLSTPAS